MNLHGDLLRPPLFLSIFAAVLVKMNKLREMKQAVTILSSGKRNLIPILSVCLLLLNPSIKAQVQLNDSATVSLLTASPWNGAIYALFGHTAIRVRDDSTGIDEVYNYGFFDSSQPGFIYNFVRGRTDYILGVTSFADFIYEYRAKGQQVVEQQLNLSPAEKQKLYDALYENALPENRKYRYNYFYDNCATRPRDMVEQYSNGEIHYPPTDAAQSYRDLVHESLVSYPWYSFGIDLLIGSEADRILHVREKMFMPSYLMDSFAKATIYKEDSLTVPLVSHSELLLSQDLKRNGVREQGLFTPLLMAFALLLLSIMVSVIQFFKMNRGQLPRIYDTILFGVAGAGGVIIFILMYFSSHPATNPNWNLIWLHPAALIAAPFFWVKSAQRGVYFYHFINFVLLTLFFLCWWFIPQQLPLATIPFSMSLWIRSASNILIIRKLKIKERRFTSSREMKAAWGQ
jgi:hypothetical protein